MLSSQLFAIMDFKGHDRTVAQGIASIIEIPGGGARGEALARLDPAVATRALRAAGHVPAFDVPVGGDGGYAWWYLDATSSCGTHGLTVIAFIGSVFSPYYAWSGWRDPAAHCAVNVALYRLDGRPGGRWAMTERGARSLERSRDAFVLGASSLRWENDTLRITLRETGAPVPMPLRGEIVVHPQIAVSHLRALDPGGRHVWRPLAPRAKVVCDFTEPALRWSGPGYLDMNTGTEPLERAFRRWHWGRAHLGGHDNDPVALQYDVTPRTDDGAEDPGARALGLRVLGDGSVVETETLPRHALPRGFWGVGREGWSDPGSRAEVRRTLEDAPFYLRSLLRARIGGEQHDMMHESLDLNRLRHPVVRAMLPFRMPRMA